ncbi:DNA ligase D [Sphingobacterium sp. SRCM116780]|uniref:DNA ligase D n=1 Tax=Sphingobacterium sp. SRCM116780 TaxID=2907623 RepID=UPI001F42056D|nr:DNA ligase D [Sphingobacterium sp. SRCM116780]UIR57268.1 DNA ligase D [Sphingobacterium sp. SRCM116780]
MGKLSPYQNKRDFNQTKEPSGAAKSRKVTRLRFVVQRHHASRLHYDFRLELDGVLKSWAVPKGPSMNPQDKRLAVRVEDHPIDYASFEGSIPEGNYGAGQVSIFDAGYYDFLEDDTALQFLKKLENGSLKFILHGHILKGEFVLVLIKDGQEKNWLLIKHKDKYATQISFDIESFIDDAVKKIGRGTSAIQGKKKDSIKTKEPPKNKKDNSSDKENGVMLTQLVSQLPEDVNWIYEKKYDGFRLLASVNKQQVNLVSRNGLPMNKLFPSIVKSLEEISLQNFQLDGEIVVEDQNGYSKFQELKSGEPLKAGLLLKYYIFDILELNGNDLTSFPLFERKELLDLTLKKHFSFPLLPVETLAEKPSNLLSVAAKMGWEGIIGKLRDSSYQRGKRTGDWIKVKVHKSLEALICGYTQPQGTRDYFGALVLGYYDHDRLIYLGNCGTGFKDSDLKELYQEFEKLIRSNKPFDKSIKIAKEKEVTWLIPKLVAEIYYSDWTQDHHLRQPVFKGLRTDKTKDSMNTEEIKTTQLPSIEKEQLKINRHLVQLSHLDKIYWPEEGYTKGQMLAYYEQFGDFLLPYLHDKPISLHRFPNGINSKGFFQKDLDIKNLPSWIKTKSIFSESSNRDINYLICNNKETLLYLANLGSIEINPWLSSYKKPDKPTFAVLDLDPNGMDFQEVVQVALTVKEIMDEVNVQAHVKTSGSSGLHIYFYLKERYAFEVVRNFVEWLATLVQQKHPDTTSIERNLDKRKGLIYLDYLQNRSGQTVVAPYSIRPKKGATISAPLDWKEVNPNLEISLFNIETMPGRLQNNPDPWQNIWDHPIDLKQALLKL